MDKEFYNELEKVALAEEEKIKKDSSNLDIEVCVANKLVALVNEKFTVDKNKNVIFILTFYNYAINNIDKDIYERYKKVFSNYICNYYTKDKITNNIDKIVNDNMIDTILDLSDENLVNNLVNVIYEKSKNSDEYKKVYETLKTKLRDLGIVSTSVIDIDLENNKISDNAKDLLNVIDYANKVVDTGSYDVSLDGDKLSSDHEKRVNEAMEKINQMALERGIDDTKESVINVPDKEEPEVSINQLNDNNNIFNSPNPISSDDYEKQREAFDAQILNLKLRQKELDRKENERVNGVFENAANEIGMEGSLLRNRAEKSGINTLKIDKISISEEMSQMVANGVSITLPRTRFNMFIENLFMKQKLKSIEMNVEEIDNQKVLKTSSTMRFDKIASCENAVIKSIEKACQRKAKCKKLFIDTKNNVLKVIKELAIKSIEKVEDVKDKISDINYDIRKNISDRLMDAADRISPEYYNPYDVTGRVELGNEDEPILNPEDNMLELLKNNSVTGISATPIAELPALNDENQMKM